MEQDSSSYWSLWKADKYKGIYLVNTFTSLYEVTEYMKRTTQRALNAGLEKPIYILKEKTRSINIEQEEEMIDK